MAMIDIIEINLGESLADAALLDTANVVFNASFRLYCEKTSAGNTVRAIIVRPIAARPEEMKQVEKCGMVYDYKEGLCRFLLCIFMIKGRM